MKVIVIVLAGLFSLPLVAQQSKPIDFTIALKGLDGKTLMSGDKTPEPVTLGEEVEGALVAPLPTDSDESQSHKIARSKLADRLLSCKSCVLSVYETGLILERANKVFPALIFGQIAKILDPVAWEKADL